MLTRRRLLSNGLTMGVGLAAHSMVSSMTASAQLGGGTSGARQMVGRITGSGSLRAHAAAHGLLAGSAVNVEMLTSQTAYPRVVAEQYSIVVPDNAMKWLALRPAPDRFSFAEGDALVAFAEQHGIKVRGHNLAWHQALPGWFASTVNKENARQFLTGHILTVAGHYRGKLQSWDVVNEAVDPHDGRPDGLRNTPWMQLLGPDYIEIAFRAARQADPDAVLTYNDYGIEDESDDDQKKRAATLQLLRRLKAANVPIGALGIQSHIKAGVGQTYGKGLRELMASVRELGLKVYITEMDVNDDGLPYDDAAQRDRAVAAVYSDYLNLVLAEPAVDAVLTWGFTDRSTWLDDIPEHKKTRPNRRQRALPFDEDYQPTAVSFAIRDAFDRRTGRPPFK